MWGSEAIVVERAIGYLAQNYVSGWIEWVVAVGGGGWQANTTSSKKVKSP